jgi:hypothetical protein
MRLAFVIFEGMDTLDVIGIWEPVTLVSNAFLAGIRAGFKVNAALYIGHPAIHRAHG